VQCIRKTFKKRITLKIVRKSVVKLSKIVTSCLPNNKVLKKF